MIDDTYLTLRGWEAYLIEVQSESVYIMYNTSTRVIINRSGIIHGETIIERHGTDFRVSHARHSDAPSSLIQAVFNFEESMTYER